jgi:hypothetical protein
VELVSPKQKVLPPCSIKASFIAAKTWNSSPKGVDVSDAKQKTIWVCPICKIEVNRHKRAIHIHHTHKAWETEIGELNVKVGMQTPFSMRQWGDDRPKRTGPI